MLCGAVLSRLFFFLFSLVAIRMLSVEDYGLYALLMSMHAWLLIVAHFDFPFALSKNVSENLQQNETGKIGIYYTCGLILAAVFSLSAMAAGVLLSAPMNISAPARVAFFSSLIAISIYGIHDGVLKGHGLFKWTASLDILNGLSRFMFLLIIFAICRRVSIDTFLYAYFAATFVPLLLAAAYVHRLDFKVPRENVFEWEKAKIIFSFSKWICFTDLASAGGLLLLNFIVALYSYEDVAILNVAFLMYQVANMALASITNVLVPTVSGALASGQIIAMPDKRFLFYLFIVSITVALMIVFIPDKQNILTFIFKKSVYEKSITLAAILIAVFPLRIFSTVAKGILQGMNCPQKSFWVSFGALFFLAAIAWPLYRITGLYGLVTGVAASYILEYLLYMTIVKRALTAPEQFNNATL